MTLLGHCLYWMALGATNPPRTEAPRSRADYDSPGSAPTSPKPLTFDDVYSQNFDFVWRSVRGLGAPSAAVDDVTQDVFLIVHRKLPTLEHTESLRSWLFGIARRVCKDHRRSATRRGVHLPLDAQRETCNQPDPQSKASDRQAMRLVQTFADGLDEEHRALFFLALVEGLPTVEVASTLGLNANTTYSRVRALRKELTELLDSPTATEKSL